MSPQAVAAIDCPSVSRKLNRPVAPAASTAPIVSDSAAAMERPARSRASASAHRKAESTIASSDSRVAAPPAVSAAAAADAGQPARTPLWLNSHGPDANGAAACSPAAMPAVALRTAASTAADRVTRAISGSDSSAQIGTARRYRAGVGSPSAYQPTPNPSAFTVPWRISRGAHACRYRPCGGSISTAPSAVGGPR